MLETCGSPGGAYLPGDRLKVPSKADVGAWPGRYDPMLTVVPDPNAGDDRSAAGSSLIDEIVRDGARRMLAEALQAEVDAYIAQFAEERDERGRRVVVRNGYHAPREVLTSAGAVEVTVARVNDKGVDPGTGERRRFSSAILPPWARKTPKITEVLPLLYLHGLSSGLRAGAGAVPRLVEGLVGAGDHEADRAVEGRASRVLRAGSVNRGLRVSVGGRDPRQHPPGGRELEEGKLCLLVMIGVRADGGKELIALSDGYRESAGSWADLLRDCQRRGMRAPVLAAGDGALGFSGRAARGVP
jgi:hypothetical protein